MSEAIRFLHALAHALSTMALYSPGHPAGKRAIDSAWQALGALLESNPHPAFLFLGGPPVYGGRALHELSDWPWCGRFAELAIQRVDFDRTITPAAFDQVLELWQRRLAGGAEPETPETHLQGVTFGPVEVQTLVTEDEVLVGEEPPEHEAIVYVDLVEELDAVRYVFAEAREGRVARMEAESVVRLLLPVVERHTLAQADVGRQGAEPPAHALNTALLAMAAGLRTGLGESDTLQLGVAALWHDVGVARLPFDLATKSSLSVEERVVMERHTVLGATLLLSRGGPGLELAAQVAFEHHLRPDGTGYPARRFAHPPHWASALIGVAASYVAVRADRPYRAAWSPERALAYVQSSAGSVFDQVAAELIAGLVAA